MKKIILLLVLVIFLNGCLTQQEQAISNAPVNKTNSSQNHDLNASSNQTPPKTDSVTASPVTTNPITKIKDVLQSCPTKEEILQFESDFSITFDDAPKLYSCENGKNPNYNGETSTGETGKVLDPRLTIYQTLRIARAMNFSKPFPWTEKDLYGWLKDNIIGIHVSNSTQYSFCCSPSRVINLKSEVVGAWYQTDWINKQAGTGIEGLVTLIMHEARHTTHGHTCGSNDKTIDEMGAWAVQYNLLYWMANYLPSDFQSEYEQESIAAQAENIKKTRFCG